MSFLTERSVKITDALVSTGIDSSFKVLTGGTLVEIIFKYGNCKHTHPLIIGYNEDDGVGIEYNACLPRHEPDLFELLLKGVFLTGENVLMEPGKPCRCHDNAALLADEHEHVAIMTGYGLSVDGLWRQHSWCINTLNDQLIETTVARLIYFGIVIN